MFLDGSPDAPLKAIDFGISVFCRPGQYVDVRAGTPIYIAPEVGAVLGIGLLQGARAPHFCAAARGGRAGRAGSGGKADAHARGSLARRPQRPRAPAPCAPGPPALPARPQVLRMKYTLSADIWSLGIVGYQLLTGRLPFSGEEGQEVADTYMEKQVGGCVGMCA